MYRIKAIHVMNVKCLLLPSMLSAVILITSVPAIAADQSAVTRPFALEKQHSPILELGRQIQELQAGATETKLLSAEAEGGKFILSSKDGNYTLRPTMRIQLQHLAEIIQDAPNTNGFSLRRGRFGIKGNAITTDLEYKINFDFGTPDPGDPHFNLKDLYLDYRFNKDLHLKGGQFKVPFGLQSVLTSKKLQFVERALATEEFTQRRDIGMMAWGPYEGAPLEYYGGIFNGDKDNELNANTELMYAGRLVLNPIGRFKKGESDMEGTSIPRLRMGIEGIQNQDNTAGDNLLTLGSFAAFKYAGLSLRSEYFNRVNFDDQSLKSDDADAQGYYAQAGYMLIPKRLEAAFRGSQVVRKGRDDDELEYVTALSYFFKSHKAKLQLDYTYAVDEGEIMGPVDETRHIVRTMFQLYF